MTQKPSKFLTFLFSLLFNSVFGYYSVNSYKVFGDTVPVLNDDQFLTLVASVSALFNSARFVWAGALDKYNFKLIYGALLLI